ncbi:hypothetical protein SAMN05660971_01793 [Halomonas cupida]|uniref:Uncharacterized protein n=1 Tax=Halomonas cupida TaxID=44933 RepID=A0A1M7EUK9_9GAMM|nr:hypothetical protein SAMN05660971_01793 [Halomonas cupida]
MLLLGEFDCLYRTQQEENWRIGESAGKRRVFKGVRGSSFRAPLGI